MKRVTHETNTRPKYLCEEEWAWELTTPQLGGEELVGDVDEDQSEIKIVTKPPSILLRFV